MATIYEQFGYKSEYDLMCDLCRDVEKYGKQIIDNNGELLICSGYKLNGFYYVITKMDGEYRSIDVYKSALACMLAVRC